MARSSSSLMSRRPATSRYGPRSWSEPKPLFHLFPTEPYSSTASRAASRSMRSSRSFSSARSSSETSAATSRPRRSRLSLTLCVVVASLFGLDVGYCVTFRKLAYSWLVSAPVHSHRAPHAGGESLRPEARKATEERDPGVRRRAPRDQWAGAVLRDSRESARGVADGKPGRGREDDGPLGGYRCDIKGISMDQTHLTAAQRG